MYSIPHIKMKKQGMFLHQTQRRIDSSTSSTITDLFTWEDYSQVIYPGWLMVSWEDVCREEVRAQVEFSLCLC